MKPSEITLIAVPGIPLVRPGDDLADTILRALREAGLSLRNGDVLVVAQKVVSKAEGRIVDLNRVRPSKQAQSLAVETGKDPRLVEVILRDSHDVVRHRRGVLIVEQQGGFVCANAGVDHSNVPQRSGTSLVTLLPADSDASAARLREAFRQATGQDVAVIINDSHGRPFRLGTCGVAIGVAGMAALSDRRGEPDLFGQPLRITTVGAADEIAAAASLLMGQADEGKPVVLVRGARFQHGPGSARDLLRPRETDLFREPVPPAALLNLLYRRQSARRYQPRPVLRDILEELVAAACTAPSAHNRQHWRFAVITARAVKDRLAQAMGESFRHDMCQEDVHPDEIEACSERSYRRLMDAPALIIAGFSAADVGGRVPEEETDVGRAQKSEFQHQNSKTEETMAVQSVAAAIENLLLAATAWGLATCWICWPLFCPDTVREALGLPGDFQAQALITLGYPTESPERKPRYSPADRAYFFLELEDEL